MSRYDLPMSEQPDQLLPILEGIIELGIVRMRMNIGRAANEAYIPRLLLSVDERSGMVLDHQITEPLETYAPVVIDSLNKIVERMGGLPREIRVRDPRFALELRQLLQPLGVNVVVRESLPKLDEAFAGMAAFKRLGGSPKPGILDVPGMTLDHLIQFADAAKAFYEAAPWRLLTDDDLIAVESPAGPTGTGFTQVLGAGGRTFGLGFVPSRKAHEQMRTGGGLPSGGLWTLQFGDIDEMPFDDGEAWERHNLPVAAADAYPAFTRFLKSRPFEYPTPEQLIWAEGLLRALAATTEDQLDIGRWEQQVQRFAGPATYRFSMPILLEQMEGKYQPDVLSNPFAARLQMEPMMRALGQQLAEGSDLSEGVIEFPLPGNKQPASDPPTDAQRAQDLFYEAMAARGRRQVQLIRQALVIDPDCTDALVSLAQREPNADKSIAILQRAITAAERRLGPKVFQEDAGHFWGLLETRPYMRARGALALKLMNLGRYGEAIPHLTELLRLNPGDNQGNRYLLTQCLLRANQFDALDKLLNGPQYSDEASPEWTFSRLLLEFRRSGEDSPALRTRLDEAQASNPLVAPLLTGRSPMPPQLPDSYRPGSKEEAILCVEQIADAWGQSPGALEWLRKNTKPRRPATRSEKKSTKKSARKKKR
jgi:tetratricopeptide (TPR) repeat protein